MSLSPSLAVVDRSCVLRTFVVLKRGSPYWIAECAYHRMPAVTNRDEVVLKGIVNCVYNPGHSYNQSQRIKITYGIERYYIPERTGSRFDRSKALSAELAVDKGGHCVLKRVSPAT